VIDVREPGEFAGGHLPGATNVPRGLLEFRVAAVAGNGEDVNPATPILVYCQSGARGALATLTLNKMGYSNVTNLADGFLGWKAAGGEVAKPE
jgi:rhodanese-related sulfurtransferase